MVVLMPPVEKVTNDLRENCEEVVILSTQQCLIDLVCLTVVTFKMFDKLILCFLMATTAADRKGLGVIALVGQSKNLSWITLRLVNRETYREP